MTFNEINEITGFANGQQFTSEQQIYDYFTTGNMRGIFGECALIQDELDAMARAVIGNGWHFDNAVEEGRQFEHALHAARELVNDPDCRVDVENPDSVQEFIDANSLGDISLHSAQQAIRQAQHEATDENR